MLTVVTVGATIGPVFAGWMFDLTNSYTEAFWVLGALTFVGSGLMLTLKRPARLSGGGAPIEAMGH